MSLAVWVAAGLLLCAGMLIGWAFGAIATEADSPSWSTPEDLRDPDREP